MHLEYVIAECVDSASKFLYDWKSGVDYDQNLHMMEYVIASHTNILIRYFHEPTPISIWQWSSIFLAVEQNFPLIISL